MAGKKKCFSTIRALRRLDAATLCDVLAKFPAYLKHCGLTLPTKPEPKNLNYEGILAACMGGDIPSELDDVLFFASILGNKKGWEQIEREADFQGVKLAFGRDGLSAADLAMKAWLHDWPENKDLLEASYARAKIFSKSSYVYNPMLRDLRERYRKPTAKTLAEATAELEEYFDKVESLGKGTNILMYDFEKEIWFLIRYPGQLERHPGIDEEGNAESFVFRPEEYDAVVYHKEYGDLRMNTNRAKDRKRYRITFGHLLLDASNVFNDRAKIIRLEPLLGKSLGIFNCDDIEELSAIEPTEVSFSQLHTPGREIVWKADNDLSLLDHNTEGVRLLPESAHSIRYAKFRYRLKNRAKWEKVTVHQGATMNYERDGDSAIVEEWLRRRGFVANVFKN